MKLLGEVQRLSKETLGHWNSQLVSWRSRNSGGFLLQAGKSSARKRKTNQIDIQIRGSCHWRNFAVFCFIYYFFFFLNDGAIYSAPNLLITDGVYLSQREKRIPGVIRIHWEDLKLGLNGGGNKIRLSRDEHMDSIPGWSAKPIDQLKCTYTNTFSTGNKQEEQKVIVQQEKFIQSPSLKYCAIILMTSVLQWRTISSLERIDEEGEVVG